MKKWITLFKKRMELGVNRIVPLITERTSTKPKMQKLAHWQGVIISGCEQSGRCCIPELIQAQLLNDWLSQKREGLSLVCHPNAKKSLANFKIASQRITLLIGPKGGLSNDEVQRAILQSGFQVLFLGPRILRTETATVTALSLIQVYFGDLQRL
ncbi:RsmE family RNA methyltransferase [Coxiella endosymbiont of Ornithodoros maritimus]|uniref:RsmE family RNA methyltransferase n=1 Tax=Coxiella endosymbiont of Ornithodoros maritimus TaxID=1656172 RepID=UPI002B3FFE60|nr:16S rRNA (uracil(1498)-N(3))-methyltransferase [Coxiella endosymbiont of Ornithodoros maritimus]